MNKILSIIVVLQILGTLSCLAQFDEQLVTKVQTIYQLATTGYDNQNPQKLSQAADLLIQHSSIRTLQAGKSPASESPNYFNAKELLQAALQFTPINKKRKRRKIQQKIDRLSDHIPMSPKTGDVFVEPIKDLRAGTTVEIPQAIGAQKLVQLRLQNSAQLGLSLFYAQEPVALVSGAEINPISLYYETKTSGNYKIEVKNKSSQQTLDTILMIMY